ncbi:hypothetical protein HS125_04835 [bacterium]|nr:hypothetical protein [bacterium]
MLDYLSEAAGFVIVREAQVDGTVDVWSHQPLSREEAVELLNTVLYQKGYAILQRGRILTIVSRNAATRSDIPVKTGRKPEEIPRTDQLVTMVIPVSYADADKLVENLRPLLPPETTLSSNHGSNSLIITGPQTDIRRMVEIVDALDTSLAAVSTVRVFPLRYADAKQLASVVTEIFKQEDQSSRDGNRMERFIRGMRGGPWGGGDISLDEGGPAALRGNVRVIAVADERTNSLVVSAPEEVMPTIAGLVAEVDTVSEDLTQIRVFPLQYASAEEMAQVITDIFQQRTQTGQTTQTQQGPRFFGFGGRGPFGGAQNNQNAANTSATGRRTVQENTVLAVADLRTNSVVVRAASELMPQVEQMIRGLDENPAKAKKVHVYRLENADPEQVAQILEGMLSGESGTSSSSTGNRNLRSQNTSNTRGNTGTSANRNTGTRNTGTRNTGFNF